MPPHQVKAETSVRRSLSIYLGLMAYLALVKVVIDLASIKGVVPSQNELFSWQLISILTIAGGVCVWLGPSVGFPALWDASISTRNRLLLPALVGLGLGAVTLTVQASTGLLEILTAAANVPAINIAFPGSILFYSGGAIILEAIYRLIPITLPLWLIANVILRKRGQTPVFWVLAVLTSAIEPAEQASFVAGHLALMLVGAISTFAINLFQAYLFRRSGFLATLAFRLAYYLVVHVVGSILGF